ncbi:MAG: allantoinase AllB [Enterocloster aldenensis]
MIQNKQLICNGRVVLPNRVEDVSLLVEDGRITALLEKGSDYSGDCEIIDASGKIVMPGMIDTHNHMGDPGPANFREDWYCGSCSAASGGITTICDMPLPSEPSTIDRESLALKKQTAGSRSVVDFALWGGLIPDSIKDMREMHDLGCVGFKGFMCFSTKVYPRITDGYLVEGMRESASFHGLVALHAENAEVADFGCRHYSEIHCQDEACFDDARPWWTEFDAIQRAVLFARMTGSRLLVCHTTITQGAEFIKNQKKEGAPVFVETCPHYLIFDRNILRDKKSFAKCTPPFRSRENVEKMWDYVKDGTIDVLGSDHGPYTDEEKVMQHDFWKEYCGFGCNDVMLAAMISEGVNKRGLSWTRLAELTSQNAARLLGLYPRKGNLMPGANADFIFIDPDENWVYDGTKSFSKTKSDKGPYHGMELKGRVTDTFVRGKRVYGDGRILCDAGYGRYIRSEG